MEKIALAIEERRKKLENTEFCRWLSDDKQIHEDRFTFTPSMLFFVLGFKDILTQLRTGHTTNEIELQINRHCDEDLNHWKWYLHDLEVLGFLMTSWGGSITDVFKKIWDDENESTRKLVYSTIHYIKQSQDPIVKLIIIEVLETAFKTFIKNMTIPIKRANIYAKLDYFGKTHFDKEMEHSLQGWSEENTLDLGPAGYNLTEKVRASSERVVADLFDQFEEVFDCWYSSRDKYKRIPGKLEEIRPPQERVPQSFSDEAPTL